MIVQDVGGERRRDCLSDLVLDRLLDGELTGKAEGAAAEAHLAGCARCRSRRAAIEAAPVQAPDPAWWKGRSNGRAWRRALLASGTALAAAAAVAVVFWARPAPVDGPATQLKGGAVGLELLVRRKDGRVEPVLPGVSLHPGDEVGLRIRTADAGYLAIVGLDAGGKVSRYAPARAGEAVALQPGVHEVPRGVIMDGTLGDERVLALVCPMRADAERAIDVARVALARAGGPGAVTSLDLPCAQTSVPFHKAAPP